MRAPPVSFSICSIVPLCSVEMLSAFEPFLGAVIGFSGPSALLVLECCGCQPSMALESSIAVKFCRRAQKMRSVPLKFTLALLFPYHPWARRS